MVWSTGHPTLDRLYSSVSCKLSGYTCRKKSQLNSTLSLNIFQNILYYQLKHLFLHQKK